MNLVIHEYVYLVLVISLVLCKLRVFTSGFLPPATEKLLRLRRGGPGSSKREYNPNVKSIEILFYILKWKNRFALDLSLERMNISYYAWFTVLVA